MSKPYITLVKDYAQRIANGKTIPFAERLSGAIEIESASKKTERETRAFFNDTDVSTDFDPSIRTPDDSYHKVELHCQFKEANIEKVLYVANEFSRFSTANGASGIHIHLNLSALVGNLSRRSSLARLERLKPCTLSDGIRFQNLLFGMNGGRLREQNAHVDYHTEFELERAQALALESKLPHHLPSLSKVASGQKYKLFNWTNANNGEYDVNDRTLECRAWSASVAEDYETFKPVSARHVEACFFVLVNLMSTSLSNTNKTETLRKEPKHARAFDSFKWFLHHCAKRAQLPIWKDKERVEALIHYIFQNCKEYDTLKMR